MTSGNNDRRRCQSNKKKNKVKNSVVSDDTPTSSPPIATHVFHPQHQKFPSSGHTTMSPQYAPGISPSTRVFSSMPSQSDSLMPPPGYGYGNQYRPPPGLHPSSSPGYHIRKSRKSISTIASPSPSSSRASPSATSSPQVSPNISGLHLRDSSSSESDPEPPSPATPVEGGNPPIIVPGTDREIRDRITIIPAGIGFDPQATNAVTKAIQHLYDLPYPTWSDFPYDLRQTMFNEFKKKCVWLPEYNKQIAKNFEKKASARLSQMFSAARRLKKKPNWVGDKAYKVLLKYWQSPEFLEKSAQARKARASEKGGSLYCGGAKPQSAWKKELEVKHGGKLPFGVLFQETHTKKRKPEEGEGAPVWGEARAGITHEAYTRRMEDYIQNKGCDEQGEPYKPSDEEEIGIWLEVCGGVHKGRAYGLSSERSFHRLDSGLRGIGTSSDAEALDRDTLENMQQKIARLNEELQAAAVAREADRVAREADRVAREAERVRLDNDMTALKSQMKHFVRNVLPHSDESDGD